jgi:hypothetical protein
MAWLAPLRRRWLKTFAGPNDCQEIARIPERQSRCPLQAVVQVSRYAGVVPVDASIRPTPF